LGNGVKSQPPFLQAALPVTVTAHTTHIHGSFLKPVDSQSPSRAVPEHATANK
jgi:hypothetical protein